MNNEKCSPWKSRIRRLVIIISQYLLILQRIVRLVPGA